MLSTTHRTEQPTEMEESFSILCSVVRCSHSNLLSYYRLTLNNYFICFVFRSPCTLARVHTHKHIHTGAQNRQGCAHRERQSHTGRLFENNHTDTDCPCLCGAGVQFSGTFERAESSTSRKTQSLRYLFFTWKTNQRFSAFDFFFSFFLCVQNVSCELCASPAEHVYLCVCGV